MFYLLVKPDHWEINTENLLRAGHVSTTLNKSRKKESETSENEQNEPRMGEKTLRRLLGELEEAGYLTRKMINTKKGGKWLAIVYDTPQRPEERTSTKGRTRRKNEEEQSPSASLRHLGKTAKKAEPKCLMPKLRHEALGLTKKTPTNDAAKDDAVLAQGMQKHVNNINMRSRSHVSFSCKTETSTQHAKQKKRAGVITQKTRLPETLGLSEELLEFCKVEAPKINPFRAFEEFKDHALETGRECVDWHAAMRRWFRRAQEISEGRTVINPDDDAKYQRELERGFELLRGGTA